MPLPVIVTPPVIPDRVVASIAMTSRPSSEELLPLAEVERRHVLAVVEACRGNRTDAAKILGVDRKTLYRKLQRYGVVEPR